MRSFPETYNDPGGSSHCLNFDKFHDTAPLALIVAWYYALS